MDPDYIVIRNLARNLVKAAPLPDFYVEQIDANRLSLEHYQNNEIIQTLKGHVSAMMDNNLGHGLHHAERVSLDAGALALIVLQRKDLSAYDAERVLLLGHCAGLLHDVMRKKKDHACAGADYAAELLKSYPFSREEINDICQAIRNHEAFKENSGVLTVVGEVVSNCLYDADKFRWGPDNFTHTVWDMVTNARIPLSVFMSHFPRGIATVARIRNTFRSNPGKKYGPQFIDIGMDIGRQLYDTIKREFPAIFKG